MDVELSPDQLLFAETTRKFLEADPPLSWIREVHAGDRGVDPDYWRKAARLGWTAMLVPEAFGGGSVSGNGLLDLVLVAEEMGRTVSPGPLLAVNVVADTLVRSGSEEQRARILPALVSGDIVATWALAEGSGSWSPAAVELRATLDGDHWVLDGVKTFVPDVAPTSWLLVTARAEEGLTQFLVPGATDGIAVSARESLDLLRPFADVSFTGVRLPASAVVGSVGGAADDVQRQLSVALVIQNAETVGAVDAVLSLTIEYAKDRIAFGRPVASYQAIKHRFANMKTWLEACHGTATASARAVAAGAGDADLLASAAKSYIADRAPQIVQDCIQIHGGIGVTWDHDLHVYLRRVTQNTAMFGSVRDHRELLAAALLDR